MRNWLVSAIAIGFAIVLWDVAVRLSDHTLIPGPLAVVSALGELASTGRLFRYAVASLFRVTWGFMLAVAVGIPLGLALGWWQRGARIVGPVVQFLRPISPLAWIPLAILWFGVGDGSAIFLIFIATVLPLMLTAMEAARGVNRVHAMAARNFGLSGLQILRRVVLPSARADLISGIRVALGIAWLVVVAAEMIAVNSGLGFQIIDARNAGDRYDLVVAGMLSIGLIGLLIDTAIRRDRVKLAASGVEMRFGDTRVLEPVDLNVKAGELVCIVGPSGCGKSTLLQILAGFIKPTAGRVTADGAPVTKPDRKRIFVFQERGVFPWLTVAENIAFGVEKAQRADKVRELVELIGLKGFEHAYPHQLSGGMKQRVEVARALAVDPDVLFLDEPFGALDSITRLTMRAELLRIWQAAKKTVLFVTHDVDESVQLADRVVVMSARPGRIQKIVDVDIPRPRDLSSPRYLELRDGILAEIGLAHEI